MYDYMENNTLITSDPSSPLRVQTSLPPEQPVHDGGCQSPEEPQGLALEVESSWQEEPVRLPAYTPSTAESEASRGSPPTTPVDDPIHYAPSKKHFGFSRRQSIASSIFPWRKHKPAVFHQYAPHHPPSSKRASFARLKVLPVTRPESVKHLEDEELDLLNLDEDQLAKRVLELLHLMNIQDWTDVIDHHSLELFRISGALTNCIFLVTGPPRVVPAVTTSSTFLDKDSDEPVLTTKPRKVLLRVYGVGLEALISRNEELYWLRNLSTMEIGPSLLGIFKNGRFEEYVDSTTLTKEDIRNPRTSRHIAHRMCELHNIVNVFPPPEGTIPKSQANIIKWIPLAREAIEKICAEDPAKRAIINEFDFEKLLREFDEIQLELATVHSPLVFAHNDTQYGNILKTNDESGELVVIDFEYAGYNTRGFDIGNHFCEWTADYHSERPSVLHPERYPTKAEQFNFLEAYMEAEIAMRGYHLTAIDITKYAKKRRSITNAIASGFSKATLSALQATSAVLRRKHSGDALKEDDISGSAPNSSGNTTPIAVNIAEASTNINNTTFVLTDGSGLALTLSNTSANGKGNGAIESNRSMPRSRRGDGSGGVSKAEVLESMYNEVNKFALTSHIMWGLWGLIQAAQSEIDFNYFEYSMQRLSEFRRRREEFMAL
ncbi:hypothetical protein BGZ80_002251 [Entomortierella chlamydospora]|uniref:Choline kinase n=1 Tax=Entomortierella chlamydospora TaxID=101097 RepID=A0A9P6N2M8_9FUNG|nr:hypothetical protein BGZ80_002251 [Entomortierella chlamydospora]